MEAYGLENNPYEEMIYDTQIEQKLRLWKAFQEEEGAMDNSINEVLAYYRTMHPPDPLKENSDSRFHFSYRRSYTRTMEDTAVSMAIRNHGLVQSTELALQPHYKCIGIDSFSSKCMYELKDFPYGTVYSNVETGRCNALDADKIYECDQPEDFLERAVGEAIKKKGLSALSVDYG